MNLEYFEEELNTSVDVGRGKIKDGFGVGNSFPTPDRGWGQCKLIWNLLRKSSTQV